MACPTCNGTMQSTSNPGTGTGAGPWGCPRCGTLKIYSPYPPTDFEPPASETTLAARVKRYIADLGDDSPEYAKLWQAGIIESVKFSLDS